MEDEATSEISFAQSSVAELTQTRNPAPLDRVRPTRRPISRARRMRSFAIKSAFVLPVVVLVVVLLIVPTLSVLFHAFTNWSPGAPSPGVGLKNFTDLATSDSFHHVLINQGILLLGIPLWTVLPLILAVALHERVAVPGVFRTIFFLPATVSPAIIGILFTFLLAPSGPVNSLMSTVGLGRHNWLTDTSLVRPTLIVVLAWATIGTGVAIFSAALTTVDAALFEAAELDGAGWWRRLWHIALPQLRHVIELWVVILVMTVFVAIFPWIFTLTHGGPGDATTTMDFDIYQNAFGFGYFGTAAAEAVYLLVIVGVVIGIGSLISRKLK
jgi:ABC-type sugar transport system permease subunit